MAVTLRLSTQHTGARLNEPMDVMTCPVITLIQEANRLGVHYFLPPCKSTHHPTGRLMVWNHRSPEGQRIVEAMRARREEVATHIQEHRPKPLTVSAAEERYRRDVLNEPDADLPVGEMTWGTLASLVRSEVHTTIDERLAPIEERAASSVSSQYGFPRPTREWRMRL